MAEGGGPWTMADVHYVELHGEKREVVAFCEEYVDILSRVVQAFIEKPPKPKGIRRGRIARLAILTAIAAIAACIAA